MPNRERDDSGKFAKKASLEDILKVFEEVRGPAITSRDVAEHVDCSTETARQKLAELYDRGSVDKRKSGRTTIWWHTGGKPIEPDERVGDDAEKAREIQAKREQSRGEESENAERTHDAKAPETVDEALDGWEPNTNANTDNARSETKRAAAYLRERSPERLGKGEFTDALATDEKIPFNDSDYWWNRAVQPGLSHLDSVGVVDFRKGHYDYQWTGDEADDSADVYDPTTEFEG